MERQPAIQTGPLLVHNHNRHDAKMLKTILTILLLIVLFAATASAQRYIVATAHDTEGFQSGWSNEVYWSGGQHKIILEWSPNSEPDLDSYQLWVGYQHGGEYFPSIKISCPPGESSCCTITIKVDDPINIELKGD